MRVLLDTHAFLWFIEGSALLSPEARRVIEHPDTERLISVAGLWEMAIKMSIGRLESKAPFAASVQRMLDYNRIAVLHPSLDELEQVSNLSFHHKDPFDRLMIAQALSQRLPLISNDQIFDEYGVDRRW